jgi:hypothetical protein
MASHVSLVSLLTILESATADTVQFKNLKIDRKSDNTLAVSASLVTSSLDGALFQRATYDGSTLIANAKIGGVALVPGGASTDGKTSTKSSVNFNADFVFSADKILFKPLVSASGGNSAPSETINPSAVPTPSSTPATSSKATTTKSTSL